MAFVEDKFIVKDAGCPMADLDVFLQGLPAFAGPGCCWQSKTPRLELGERNWVLRRGL